MTAFTGLQSLNKLIVTVTQLDVFLTSEMLRSLFKNKLCVCLCVLKQLLVMFQKC
jgi:hypothetical protein